ncbi:hypothetical protein HYQ45_012451 [Verticillium longisporum]|uniref:Uncharacterized protein n=1 Tax=Verticillium longisporum TaxID=100787 RepID=A0A8I2ZFW7_VERLO|nr:hypothetical protein HYQ45_012451 [Verticillium longisporum]KAG7152360.1 hypothetical protein HYQ46_011794 [Verticillium longisporum]
MSSRSKFPIACKVSSSRDHYPEDASEHFVEFETMKPMTTSRQKFGLRHLDAKYNNTQRDQHAVSTNICLFLIIESIAWQSVDHSDIPDLACLSYEAHGITSDIKQLHR